MEHLLLREGFRGGWESESEYPTWEKHSRSEISVVSYLSSDLKISQV